jgi:release factor glutamine methyltransferase
MTPMQEPACTDFWTVSQALDWARAQLRNEPTIVAPEQECGALLTFVLDVPSSFILAHSDDLLSDRQRSRFENLVRRRASGEPRAYVLGTSQFWGLELRVTSAVLDPRPETELCVEQALDIARHSQIGRAVDIGTGSGNIAIALAHERRDIEVMAVDIDGSALGIAKRNAVLNGLEAIRFVRMNWLDACAAGTVDLVVSNPPYVESSYPLLQDPESPLRFEPQHALDAGPDPETTYIRLVASAARALSTRGHVVLEHGAEQGEMVRRVLRTHRFGDIATIRDLAGHERVTLGRRTP